MRFSGVFFPVWVIAFLFLNIGICAGEGNWVTVEAEAPMIESQDAARQAALEQARQLAIAKVVAADLTFEDLYVHSRMGGGMAHAIPHGEIVKSDVLSERATLMTAGGVSSAGGNYKVRFKASVEKSVEGKNPAFRVYADLNQGSFVDGQEMQLRIQATADCHIMAFVLMEDERVLKLIPSVLGHDTFLPARQRFDFPSAEDVQRGIHLQAHLSESNTLIHEAIYILALKKPIKGLAGGDIKEGIFSLYDGQTAQLKKLVRQIIPIPPDQRAEALLYYQIRPRIDS